MAKCPLCSARKGKRSCPARGDLICARCCAEHRLETIPCPPDCPHLGSEFYQRDRRAQRAQSRGRRFLAAIEERFVDDGARELVFALAADAYWWSRRVQPLSDAELSAAVATASAPPSVVVLPNDERSLFRDFLATLLGSSERYRQLVEKHRIDERGRDRTLEMLERWIGDGTDTAWVDLVAEFFGELEFEADLDYSPAEEIAGTELGERLRNGFGIVAGESGDDSARDGSRSSGLVLPDPEA